MAQKQNIINLYVDTNRNYTAALSPKLSTSHAQPLYFGRVPGMRFLCFGREISNSDNPHLKTAKFLCHPL